MAGRIYVVESEDTVSLVRSVSAAKALTHVVKSSFQVRVASADDVAKYMAMGAEVEDSTGETQETPEAPEAQDEAEEAAAE